MKSVLRLRTIALVVCDEFGTSFKELTGPRRSKAANAPRIAFYHLARELTARSYPQIGAFIGRDHTSVLSGARRGASKVELDPTFRALVERCADRLRNIEGLPGAEPGVIATKVVERPELADVIDPTSVVDLARTVLSLEGDVTRLRGEVVRLHEEMAARSIRERLMATPMREVA